MYEDKTYEHILQEMLNRVSNDVDKREGSVIYDALAPAAYFLADQYFQLSNFIDLVLPDTAVGEYLDRAVSGYGMTRKLASPSIRKIVTTGDVAIGTRWLIQHVAYRITGQLAENEYKAECETAGKIGNTYSGSLEALTAANGVTAELTDIITDGADEETDDALRARFYEKVRRPATSGNAYHYRQWALEVSGVGDAKVFPLDSGPGTVGILIVDSEYKINSSLESVVSEHIETVRPIGASVTVSSPAANTIAVSAKVLLDGTKTREDVLAAFKANLEGYLKATTFKEYRVSYAKVGSLLLSTEGVRDCDSLTLNGTSGNIIVGEKEIPVIGDVNLEEVSTLGLE